MAGNPKEDKVVEFIPKPSTFSLDKFRSKRAAAVANVDTLPGALPHHSIAQAKDFVRLHPDEDRYWSPELCFVNVPIKGQKRETLHLIDEELALRFLPSGKIQRFRLALATKPFDVFFLCHVPTRNEDNSWNVSNLQGMRTGEDVFGCKQPLEKKSASRRTRSTARATQTRSPTPKWPSQQTLEN